jgi:hypothetical protein
MMNFLFKLLNPLVHGNVKPTHLVVVSLVYQSVSVLLKEELNFGIFIPSN